MRKIMHYSSNLFNVFRLHMCRRDDSTSEYQIKKEESLKVVSRCFYFSKIILDIIFDKLSKKYKKYIKKEIS